MNNEESSLGNHQNDGVIRSLQLQYNCTRILTFVFCVLVMIVIGLALVLLVTQSTYSISTSIYCSQSNTSAINYTPTLYADPQPTDDTTYVSQVCFLYCYLFLLKVLLILIFRLLLITNYLITYY